MQKEMNKKKCIQVIWAARRKGKAELRREYSQLRERYISGQKAAMKDKNWSLQFLTKAQWEDVREAYNRALQARLQSTEECKKIDSLLKEAGYVRGDQKLTVIYHKGEKGIRINLFFSKPPEFLILGKIGGKKGWVSRDINFYGTVSCRLEVGSYIADQSVVGSYYDRGQDLFKRILFENGEFRKEVSWNDGESQECDFWS